MRYGFRRLVWEVWHVDPVVAVALGLVADTWGVAGAATLASAKKRLRPSPATIDDRGRGKAADRAAALSRRVPATRTREGQNG